MYRQYLHLNCLNDIPDKTLNKSFIECLSNNEVEMNEKLDFTLLWELNNCILKLLSIHVKSYKFIDVTV